MKIPQRPPNLDGLFDREDFEVLEKILTSEVKASQRGHYRHWDEIRFREPPEGLSPEDWWFAIKFARRREYQPLPLDDASGRPFIYMMPDKAWERVHKEDQRLGGRITLGEEVANPSTRDRYLVNSLIEEAITSSQLEGASTTKQVAKDMIKSGRFPRDKSERMILNNYYAMNFIRENRNESLTPGLVLELHRLVTDGTLEKPEMAGRAQLPGEDRVRVLDRATGVILHEPPPAEQLSGRLKKMCDFANGEKLETFLHPVVRAVIVHFWLAYDHPFDDGNGRTARALFYWSLLSQGYWLAEFLTISSILTKAPVQYARSFLYTETDDNDLTYFIMYQLQVVMRAINGLEGYLQRKMAEVKRTERLIKQLGTLNHRQTALLNHALRHPDHSYTVRSHSLSHNIVAQTARTDLEGLVDRALLDRRKIGKGHTFYPVENLPDKLKSE
ncbi:MAG: Fic family protein [Rubrobacteraceae bacterium]